MACIVNESMKMTDRWLPGVPGQEIEQILNAAQGNEITSGKFDNPASSAALATNTFGFFLNQAKDLPLLSDCNWVAWPAGSLTLEASVRFPWKGGRHPVLDCLVKTPSALIGIESKRFEPFRDKSSASFSDSFWQPVWGDEMTGFEEIRDKLHENGSLYDFVDAAQLVKHAFALRTAVHNRSTEYYGLTPVLMYLYAEPNIWPKDNKPVDPAQIARHREEITRFASVVEGDEVVFVSCSYSMLLEDWSRHKDHRIRDHADAVIRRFSP